MTTRAVAAAGPLRADAPPDAVVDVLRVRHQLQVCQQGGRCAAGALIADTAADLH